MTRLIHCSSVSSVFSSVSFELLDHPDISTPLDMHQHRNPAGDLGWDVGRGRPPPLVSPFRPPRSLSGLPVEVPAMSALPLSTRPG